MGLISKRTRKPSNDMSGELIDDPEALVSERTGEESNDLSESLIQKQEYDRRKAEKNSNRLIDKYKKMQK